MANEKYVNIARLMTSYNFEFEELPDNLKCAKCRLVIKDAYHVPCGCTFCRVCIDGIMVGGGEFCPGFSKDCGESLLSAFQMDYRTNNLVSKLSVKCPNNGCVLQCQLANMEEHLRECPRRSVKCPFCELGCTNDTLAAEEVNGHLQHENRGHSEILIGMIAKMNRDIEDNRREINVLKQREEASRKEIEKLNQREEASRKEIEKLNQREEASRKEIEKLNQREEANRKEIEKLNQREEANRKEIEKLNQREEANRKEIEKLNQREEANRKEIEKLNQREEASRKEMEKLNQREEASRKEIEMLKQRDKDSKREIETTKNKLVVKDGQIRTIMDRMILIENENKSMRKEKADFANQVRILSEKLEQEINQRRESDELDSARLIDHVDKQIAVLTGVIESSKHELDTKMKSVKSSMESEVQSIQALVGLEPVATSCEWLIGKDVEKTSWTSDKSEYFSDLYKFELASGNDGNCDGALWIYLRIHPGTNDGHLMWPFIGHVVITVADKDRCKASRSIARQCRIERPPEKGYRSSEDFEFEHSELTKAGLRLRLGVHVRCLIISSEVQ